MRSTRSSGVAFSDCTSIRFQLPATLRRCRSNAIIAAVVGAGLAGQAVGQPAFGPAADDSFDSKLTFKVTLSPALGGQTFNITMQGPTCVARSAPHAQAADPSGPMGSGACPGGAAGLIDDAGIGLPFPTGYNIGAGVDEVHTRMMNLVLNGSGWTLRAGAAAPTALPSYGEVESRGGAFGLGGPGADSFFKIYFEIDVPASAAPPAGLTVFNAESLTVQADGIDAFPPAGSTYIHTHSIAGRVMLFDRATGCFVGWIEAGGHGVSTTIPPYLTNLQRKRPLVYSVDCLAEGLLIPGPCGALGHAPPNDVFALGMVTGQGAWGYATEGEIFQSSGGTLGLGPDMTNIDRFAAALGIGPAPAGPPFRGPFAPNPGAPNPAPAVPGAGVGTLGLVPRDNMDALSFGRDRGDTLLFSVDPASIGIPGSAVFFNSTISGQGAAIGGIGVVPSNGGGDPGDEAAGDIYISPKLAPFPPPGWPIIPPIPPSPLLAPAAPPGLNLLYHDELDLGLQAPAIRHSALCQTDAFVPNPGGGGGGAPMSIQPPKVAVGIGKNVSERLEIVEASGIKDEDAEILQTSTLELPTLQDVLLLAKVIDRASGDVVGVALNKAGQTLDVEQAKRDEINAYNLAYGKLHHKLVQRIANAKNDELFAVAIWLETPDTSAAIDNVKAAGYDFEGNKPVGERVKEAKRLLTTEKGKIYSPANKVIENAIVAIGGNIDYTAELSPLVFATMTAAQIQVAQALPGIQRIYESPELVKKMGTAAPATQNNDMVTAGHTGTASTVLGIVDSLQPVWFGNQYLNHLNGSVYRRWYVVTVSNPTGVNAARVDVTFTVGAGGDLVRFGTPTLNPDAAPVCGAPAFSTAGLTATVNWAANCVDAGSAVTFRVNTLKGPLTFSAGQWQNAAGANLGPALVAGNVTITEEFDEHATNCTGCAAMKQAAGDPAYPAGAANGMAPDINAISANFLTNGAEISGNMANFVAAVEWAITNNADLLNMSIGESISDLTFDVSDKYVDHIVFEHFIAVCVAASNECNPSAIREPGAGGNGICNTTAVGDDVQVILPGAAAAPNATLITRGPNNVMDTLPNGDDIYFALNGHVCQVTSPGLAYNAITVGAIDDLDTAALGDDVRAAYSCWIDLPGDSEKPEVSAPGSRIRTATANTADADGINNGGVNGTSFATPIVSGYLANMMDMDATLTPWPETTKAIALASTKRNVYDNAIENLGPVNWDKREGSGTIWIDKGYEIIDAGHYDKTVVGPADFPRNRIVSKDVFVNAGEQFRYAIAWSTHTSGGTHENITNDVLTTDLDLYVYDCAGNLVAWSNSFNNPYEVVAFNSPKKQNYRVEIRVFGAFGAPFEYLGEAWNADDPICEEDNLDALEVSDGAEIDPDVNGIPNGGTKFAFFSIKGMSPTAGAPDPYPGMSTGPDPTGVTPDDILVSPPPFGGPFSHAIYARGTIDIGLLPGDDLDSLVLLDNNGPDGVLQPNLDIALFTLAPGSPSLAVGGFSAGDVFMTAFAGGYSLYAPAAALGLIPPIDNIDALDIGGELPPPCPHATPSTPGSTYVDFGTGGSNPAIPAGFFGPGSDPFIGRIDLKGDPFDTNAYGNASMLAQRSNEATLADDPIGTTRTVDLEVTQLSLISINPITVTQNGGQNPQDWNVRVGLSPSIVPVGSLTAQKTHENGGTFSSTLPVQPYLIFTRASNPNDLVTLDTGEQGLPPHFFTSQGTPYVHTVEPSLSVVAPSDGTFVPGVLEVVHGVPSSQVTVQWQESDPSLPSTHTVEPPRYVITTCICLGDLNNDNVVSIVDVPIFVNVLLSVGYNECADMNGDGSNNGADIQQFVIAILNQSTCFPPGGACCLPDSSCSDGSAQDCYNAGGQYQGHGTACDTTTCPSYKTIPPGEDCWITECGYSDYSFADNPIPADFFGPGSDPFLGTIQLGGIPTGPFGTDTSVQRLGTLFFPDPLPATDSIPIELTELNLSSCQPIMITSNGGQNPQPWNVVVDLSSVPAPSGTMTVTKNGPTGGTFDTVLFVQARFTFDNGGGNLVFDTGLEALPPAQLTGTGHPWLQGTPNGPACTPTFVPGHSTPNDPCCPESCHSSFGTAPHDHCVRPPECPSCDPSGACCTTGGGCTDGLTSAHCGAIGGSYGGDNTTCAGTNCSPSIGACCLTSGVCIDGQSPGGCSSQSGTYQGDGSSCATVTCPTFVCVPAGADCWTTACPGSNYSFLQSPLPAGFFGPGSDPFTGLVTLGGSPSGPFGSDTVIQRLGDLCFPQPIPSSATVPIELVALSLVSCQPITVTYNGGQNPEQWNIAVGLSPTPAPNGTLTGTMLTPTGGTFDSVLFVQPVFTFNRVVLPATVVLDTGAAGIPPMQIGSTGAPWTTNPISGPSCSPGFHPGYTDEPVPCCPETCHSSFGTAPHDHCVRPSECPHCTPATPNDDCGTAIPLSIGSFVTGSNAAAADDVSPPACGVGTPNQGVWYSVIGNGDLLTLSTCNPGTDFDTMVEVFNGSCVAPVCVGGNDDAQPPGDPACSVAGSNLKSRFTFCSQAGVNYLIRVSGFGTNSGTLELSVSDAGPCLVPPPNDSCAVPIVIGEGLTSFSTVNATTDGPTHSAAECQYARPVYNNIWFQYTASCSGNLRVTDCAELGGSSNYDSRIAVYGTTDCAQLEFNLVGCNDDDTVNPCGDSPLFHSTVDAPVVAGVTYLISVGSFSPTGSGSGTLSVTCDSGSGLGACCVGASCSDGWDSIGCSNSGGAYQGNGSNCGTVICLPPGFGACCIGVDCSEGWDEPSCMSNGGSFLGDGSTCFPGACGSGFGACCFGPSCGDGFDAIGCATSGGFYQGDETSCGLVNCGSGPANDLCINAFEITTGAHPVSTIGAGTDGPDEIIACNFFSYTQVGADVWFRFTSPCSSTVTLDFCGADYDSKIAVYSGWSCPTSASAIVCNDDACSSTRSSLSFSALPGEQFLIRVGGYNAITGTGTMLVNCSP